MSKKKVAESKAAIAQLLAANPEVLPFGNSVESVEVLAGKRGGKLVKRLDKADTPSPRGDAIFVTLRPAPAAPGRHGRVSSSSDAPQAPHTPAAMSGTDEQLADLVRALDQAESEPGHSFVALKWFHNTYPPRHGFSWTDSVDARDQVLRAITSRGWARVEKIPNPRNPGEYRAARGTG